MEFLHPALWHDHDIDFARWLYHMWHVVLESWQWIHPATHNCFWRHRSAPDSLANWHGALEIYLYVCTVYVCMYAMWYVALGWQSWIRPVAAPCNVIRSSGIMTLIRQVAAPCNVAGGSGMTAIEFAQTSAILELYIWFQFRSYHRGRRVCTCDLWNFI